MADGAPPRATPAATVATAPITNAPSPPITIMPRRAGSAVHSATSINGEARCNVFCHENQLPNAPL